MNRRRDVRLPVLLLTAGVICLLAVAVQRLQDLPGSPGSAAQALAQNSVSNVATGAVSSKRPPELTRHFQQAVVMLHAGQYAYAVTALRRVLELSPELPEAHVNMGFALLGQGHYAAARDFFHSALELRPAQVNAYWGLAVSLDSLCDRQGALGAMRSYVHLTSENDPFLPRARAALWEWESLPSAPSGSEAAGQTRASATAACAPGGPLNATSP